MVLPPFGHEARAGSERKGEGGGMKRSLGVLSVLVALCSFIVLWGGTAASGYPGLFEDDEASAVLSGPLDFRDQSGGTNLTECPQAGLRNQAESAGTTVPGTTPSGRATRVTTSGSTRTTPASRRTRPRSTRTRSRRGTSSAGRTTTGSAGARRASTRRQTAATTGTTASRRSRRCRAVTTSTAAATRWSSSTATASRTTHRSTSTERTTRAASG